MRKIYGEDVIEELNEIYDEDNERCVQAVEEHWCSNCDYYETCVISGVSWLTDKYIYAGYKRRVNNERRI